MSRSLFPHVRHPWVEAHSYGEGDADVDLGDGEVELDAVVKRLDSLTVVRDKDFAINGLAHGLVSKDPEAALKWANSISEEGFRKTVVENVTRRIKSQP